MGKEQLEAPRIELEKTDKKPKTAEAGVEKEIEAWPSRV
jgi:hypothetical protein